MTPTIFVEFAHVAVMGRYKHEINSTTRLQMVAKYGKVFNNWEHLYKNDLSILQGFRPQLERLRELLTLNGLLFVAPESLAPIGSGRTFDAELIDIMTRYGLDSMDAAILMETQRSGLRDIVTFDRDLQRARADFNIYTWL